MASPNFHTFLSSRCGILPPGFFLTGDLTNVYASGSPALGAACASPPPAPPSPLPPSPLPPSPMPPPAPPSAPSALLSLQAATDPTVWSQAKLNWTSPNPCMAGGAWTGVTCGTAGLPTAVALSKRRPNLYNAMVGLIGWLAVHKDVQSRDSLRVSQAHDAPLCP